ncbi:MAG: helix-turn-helix domain-containing protein [Desulfosarcinaceae bacterium]|nr:helix-turn-helix domain-containing protein [Desulfosarcinaceae bacterium]
MLMDAFAIANLWHQAFTNDRSKNLFETEILTTDGAPVKALGDIPVLPHGGIDLAATTECLVVAPVLPNVTPMPADLGILGAWIRELRRIKTPIATVCTGTFILAELGLLDGKTATTNWQYARMFQRRYPKVKLTPNFMLTEADGILCTGAATAVYHLALHFIRIFGSNRLATTCSKALLVDPNRNSQTPYVLSSPLRNHGDDQILMAQQYIETHYATIESVDTLAKTVGISPRHFKRRFKSATGEPPGKYLQRIRIEAAKDRLETTRDGIEEITWAVGYRDVSSFSRLFKQHTEISPRAYREKFYLPAVG